MKTRSVTTLHLPPTERERESKREVLTKVLKAPDNHRGHIRYTQWVCNLENQLLEVVENDDVCKTLLTMAEVLTVSRSVSPSMPGKYSYFLPGEGSRCAH